MADTIVETEYGKLKGKVSQTYNDVQFYTFKGIPYAKPPVGDLRFRAPQPPEPWEGVKDATKDCNICAQFDKETKTLIGDEDCLYLNVYTPKLPTDSSSLLPVMVFFHGGGFIFGHGTDDSAHGPIFLIDKDVVIVSLNYRLGILGFLSLDREDAPGNMGLKDQVQALKWVQKNISKFGGDPKNVTIFGVSAGGASVEYLLLSPMAKGLFHKAIAQSGSSLLHWAQNDKIREAASKIPLLKGKPINDDEQLLKYLKGLSTKDLITTSMLVLLAAEFRGGINFVFVPTIEKPGNWEPFLSESSYKLLARGEFTKVPFMSGFCAREGLIMVALGPKILDNLKREKNFLEHLTFAIDPVEKTEYDTKLKNVYLDGKDSDEADAFAIDFFTDVDFLGGIYVATSLIAKHNSPVYFYEFAYDGDLNYIKKKMNINREGACHGDDVGYLIKSELLKGDMSDKDLAVKNTMVGLWTNFAKYGDPTPETNKLITTKWEPISETGIACLRIKDSLSMEYEVHPQRMKLFEELYAKKHGSH